MSDAVIPAIATYNEWLGESPEIKYHTRENARAAMASQKADMDAVAQSIHFHKDTGFWLFVSAPLQH